MFLELNMGFMNSGLLIRFSWRLIDIIGEKRKKEGNEVFADCMHDEICLGWLNLFNFISHQKGIKKSLLLA